MSKWSITTPANGDLDAFSYGEIDAELSDNNFDHKVFDKAEHGNLPKDYHTVMADFPDEASEHNRVIYLDPDDHILVEATRIT